MSTQRRSSRAARRRTGSRLHRLKIRWTDRARDDLTQILDFIAQDNPDAAVRWVNVLVEAVERAGLFPLSGRVVPEIGRAEVREVIRRTYRIVYRVSEESVEVLTVFEGHRRFPVDAIPTD